MKRMARAGLFFALLGLGLGAHAQAQGAKAAPPPARPAARAADVASVDGIMAALYEVGSRPCGKVRDWERLRTLLTPDGKMGAVGARPGGECGLRSMTLEDGIAHATKPFSEAGFFESEMARSADSFGQITQGLSTCPARKAPAHARPFVRGVNSLQLVREAPAGGFPVCCGAPRTPSWACPKSI